MNRVSGVKRERGDEASASTSMTNHVPYDYTDEEKQQLAVDLARPLTAHETQVKVGKHAYIEGHQTWTNANNTFGYDGWSCTIRKMEIVNCAKLGNQHVVLVSAVVRVTLKNQTTFHEDIGVGSSKNPNKGAAIELARKEAITDARKRALRQFGSVLGNSLRDKTLQNELVKAPRSSAANTPVVASMPVMQSAPQHMQQQRPPQPQPQPQPQLQMHQSSATTTVTRPQQPPPQMAPEQQQVHQQQPQQPQQQQQYHQQQQQPPQQYHAQMPLQPQPAFAQRSMTIPQQQQQPPPTQQQPQQYQNYQQPVTPQRSNVPQQPPLTPVAETWRQQPTAVHQQQQPPPMQYNQMQPQQTLQQPMQNVQRHVKAEPMSQQRNPQPPIQRAHQPAVPQSTVPQSPGAFYDDMPDELFSALADETRFLSGPAAFTSAEQMVPRK